MRRDPPTPGAPASFHPASADARPTPRPQQASPARVRSSQVLRDGNAERPEALHERLAAARQVLTERVEPHPDGRGQFSIRPHTAILQTSLERALLMRIQSVETASDALDEKRVAHRRPHWRREGIILGKRLAVFDS